MNFSKSKYCNIFLCPKMAWLNKYRPELRKTDASTLGRMTTGSEIGDLAKKLFGYYAEATEYIDEKLDLVKMIAKTAQLMDQGTPVICEASFAHNGLYCAVDILKKTDEGWAIYEVKSSSKKEEDEEKEEKRIYMADIAYQKYVLTQCGVNVTGVYLVRLNSDYVFDGTLDIQKLFVATDVEDAVQIEYASVAENLEIAEKVLSSEEEPDLDLDVSCLSPYKCSFWGYCAAHIPTPSVFDLYRMPAKSKMDYYHNGMVSFADLADVKFKSENRNRQIQYYLNDLGTHTDKPAIREFLGKLSYPLYFLDFETMQTPVPKFVGTRPYAQIPFQYSLHYIEEEGGELKHKEFLGVSGEDPRRAIAEQLVADIPMGVCTTAYNKSFECTRLRELAEAFPDLAEHLLDIRDHIVDLLEPFQGGAYYNRAMGGSFSIKSVLPAIYPNDPALDYHNLEDIHNGGEAMTIFPMIKDMTPDDQARYRHNLLKYCELDTYAMVKVWEALVEAAK